MYDAALVTAAEAAVEDAQDAGQVFELTTADDTFVGTDKNDTFKGDSTTIQTADTLIDQHDDDNDVFNMTLTDAMSAANTNLVKVSGIENVNFDWNAFGTAAIDATNISGATITGTSSKVGFLGNMTVTNTGTNSVVAGSGMVGTLDVSGITDGTVTGTAVTKMVVDGKTAAKDSVTVVAGANTTTTKVGTVTNFKTATVTDGAASTTLTVKADNTTITSTNATTIAVTAAAASTTASTATITTDKAGSITVDGTAATTDALTVTTGISATLDVGNTTAVETVTLTAADATTITLAAGSQFTTLDSTSADTTTLSIADIDDISAKTITNSGAGTLNASIDGSTQGAATVDLSKIAVTAFNGTGAFVGQDLVFASGATINLDKSATLNASTQFLATGTATTDTLNMSVASDLVQKIVVIDGTNDVETLNLTVALDSADTDSIATLAGVTGTKVVLTSSDKVTINALVSESLDASAMTKDLIIAGNVVAAKSTIVGGAGDNTITFSAIGANDTVAVIGNVGDDDITLGGIAAAGGEASLVLSDGNNTVNVNISNAAVEYVQMTTGDGTDKLTITGASAAADIVTFDGGDGVDTLDLSTSADVTSATFNLTDVENILVKTGEASIVDADLLNGASYNIQGSGANTGGIFDDQIAAVSDALAAKTFDFSSLTFSSALATGASGVKFTASGNNDTVTGSTGQDTFDSATNGGINVFDGGLGIDTYALKASGTVETIINTDIDKNGTDVVTTFTTTEDVIKLSAADVNALIGSTIFAAGDVIGTDSGYFKANATATAYTGEDNAGTFVYDVDGAVLFFDASGDTDIASGGVRTDLAGDDIVILGTDAAIAAVDIVFIA